MLRHLRWTAGVVRLPPSLPRPERAEWMLVLTRKANQTIMIGDQIEISVLAIVGEKVRIGIQAPREIPVFRKEVYVEIQNEGGDTPALGTGKIPS